MGCWVEDKDAPTSETDILVVGVAPSKSHGSKFGNGPRPIAVKYLKSMISVIFIFFVSRINLLTAEWKTSINFTIAH